MKRPQGSLTDAQVRSTYFVVPQLGSVYRLALGSGGYQQFQQHSERLHAAGGELLLIGWPDGTTITYGRDDRRTPIDLDTLASTYRASATLHRLMSPKAAP